MSRLHRHEVKHGLADERRKLIDSYMERSEESPLPPAEALPLEEEPGDDPLRPADAAAGEATSTELEAPAPAPSGSELTPAAAVRPRDERGDEREQPIDPDRALPPEPLRPPELDRARRTLEDINRLCEQIGRLRNEGERLCALMAEVSARLVPPS